MEAANALVIGTPVNNVTVPSVFKAWIDQILRVNRTIGMSEQGGKIGLLEDKPVHIGIASGGVFSGASARQPDFITLYLRAAFGSIGLTSLEFLIVQATVFLDQAQFEDKLAQQLETIKLP